MVSGWSEESLTDRRVAIWSFRVPSLGIVGRTDTRDEAKPEVVEAVAFTLAGDDDAAAAEPEVQYLNVEIAAS
jgi:hypothetical protein